MLLLIFFGCYYCAYHVLFLSCCHCRHRDLCRLLFLRYYYCGDNSSYPFDIANADNDLNIPMCISIQYIQTDMVVSHGDPQVTIAAIAFPKSWSSIASGLPLQGELADPGGQEALR